MSAEDLKHQELSELRERLQWLEAEIIAEETAGEWPPTGFYWSYYATMGFLLGIFGAIASLLLNVVGAPIVHKSPLECRVIPASTKQSTWCGKLPAAGHALCPTMFETRHLFDKPL